MHANIRDYLAIKSASLFFKHFKANKLKKHKRSIVALNMVLSKQKPA